MTELPNMSPHNVIIKPGRNYKAPLVVVVIVMVLFGVFAGYFYYQTSQLGQEIDHLSYEITSMSKTIADLENEVESHKFSYDDLTGSVNEYLFSIGYQCDGDAIECLNNAMQLEEEEVATDSAEFETESTEQSSNYDL